jgi:hypothetical protein
MAGHELEAVDVNIQVPCRLTQVEQQTRQSEDVYPGGAIRLSSRLSGLAVNDGTELDDLYRISLTVCR